MLIEKLKIFVQKFIFDFESELRVVKMQEKSVSEEVLEVPVKEEVPSIALLLEADAESWRGRDLGYLWAVIESLEVHCDRNGIPIREYLSRMPGDVKSKWYSSALVTEIRYLQSQIKNKPGKRR